MKIVNWEQTEENELCVTIEMQPGEETTVEPVLDFLDWTAGEKGVWLLGRVQLWREKNRIFARTCTLPAMELPEQTGRTAVYRLNGPTEEQITQQLKLLAQKYAVSSEDEQPARMGDLVTLDFDAMLEDGNRFSGSMGRNGTYHLAGGEDLPEEVCRAVSGKKADETFSCTVVLPYTYPDKRATGKKAAYTGTVKKIVHQTISALNDAFAQSLGLNDLEELRERSKKAFLQQEALAARRIISQRALHEFCGEAKLVLPKLAVQLESEYQWKQLEGRLQKSGVSLESHLRRLRKTREELDASLKRHAEEDIRMRAVFLGVARQENLTVTELELAAAEKAALQGRTGVQIDRMQLRQRLCVEKGMNSVVRCLTLKPDKQPSSV